MLHWPLGLIRLIEQVDLVGEALLHALLIGGASVVQTERHGYVTVRTIRVMNEVASWSDSFIAIW